MYKYRCVCVQTKWIPLFLGESSSVSKSQSSDTPDNENASVHTSEIQVTEVPDDSGFKNPLQDPEIMKLLEVKKGAEKSERGNREKKPIPKNIPYLRVPLLNQNRIESKNRIRIFLD